jgi:hypothetical protein
MDISVIIITSPSRSHPSTILLDSVIDSLIRIQGFNESIHVHVVMDGYNLIESNSISSNDLNDLTQDDDQDASVIDDEYLNQTTSSSHATKVRLKKGIIDSEIVHSYLEYQNNVQEKYGSRTSYSIHR